MRLTQLILSWECWMTKIELQERRKVAASGYSPADCRAVLILDTSIR